MKNNKTSRHASKIIRHASDMIRHASAGWHPAFNNARLDASLRWHDGLSDWHNNPFHQYNKSRHKGFTLIEILIVIAIISIVASVATLTIHFNQSKQMEGIAQNLKNLITLAEEEAILRPAILGLAFSENHFQVYKYQENTKTWQSLPNKVFQKHNIPDKTHITLKIHNKEIPANGIPQLIISSNGDIPAFTISIAKNGESPSYEVIGEESGNVYVK